jgi:hypothetical protein
VTWCLAHCLRQPHRRRAGVTKESKIENTRLVVCSKGLGEGELLMWCLHARVGEDGPAMRGEGRVLTRPLLWEAGLSPHVPDCVNLGPM